MLDLSEYTVLDLSWLLPGPFGTRHLSDLGMEIIKIEEPTNGDYARWLDPKVKDTGLSHLFHTVNRNKKSVAIDLSTDEGTAAFLELAANADVVFEQFRPGVVERLGVDYESIRSVNEDIVYCSLTGYGRNGPYSGRVNHDINWGAVAGLLDKTKSRDSDLPTQPGFPVGDMAGGMAAAFGIVIGLLNRELGNGGQYFDISMTDVIFSMGTGQEWEATYKNSDQEIPEEYMRTPVDLRHPCHAVYPTADGEYVTVAAVEEKFWNELLDSLDREDLREYQYARGERGHYAYSELASEFEKRTHEEWADRLSDEVPVAPVNRYHEAFKHEQIQARDMVKKVDIGDETITQTGFPMQTSSGVDGRQSRAPLLGEHSREVLSSVLSTDDIDWLIESDVVKVPE